MRDTDIQAASDFLTTLWRQGRHTEGMPAALRPSTRVEAYAVQALAVIDGAGLDPQIVNPAGGGLARGHPIGASGAILAVRLFHGLRQGKGLAAIAAAGGIGTALLVEAPSG